MGDFTFVFLNLTWNLDILDKGENCAI